MLTINWPLALTVTVALYALILLFLPFSTVYATLMLFALIAFWSRLPGVGMPNIYLCIIFYTADMVDFFSMIISINIGGIQGGVFSLFANLVSRLCGVNPKWKIVFEDATSMFITCLIFPFIYSFIGADIFVSMLIFTILRVIIFLPVGFFLWPDSYVKFIINCSIGLVAISFFNGLYAKLFGNFFNSLISHGVQFSWILFFFVTAVILIFYLTVYGTSSRKTAKVAARTVRHLVRKSVQKTREAHGKARQRNTDIDDMKKISENL